MTKKIHFKQYDFEDRTLVFAKNVRALVKKLNKSIAHIGDGKQVVRSSGSVGANYIEANKSLSKKDFIMRIKNQPQRSQRKQVLTVPIRRSFPGY